MAGRGIKLETTFTDKSNVRWIALAGAVVLLIGILLTMTTSIPEKLLPMNDVSLRALIPKMRDGSPPLALKSLEQTLEGRKTLHLSGKIENRSDSDIKGLIVVIQPKDLRENLLEAVESPVQPAPLLAFEAGTFEITAELQDRPATVDIQFKIIDGGPFVPHQDERLGQVPSKP